MRCEILAIHNSPTHPNGVCVSVCARRSTEEWKRNGMLASEQSFRSFGVDIPTKPIPVRRDVFVRWVESLIIIKSSWDADVHISSVHLLSEESFFFFSHRFSFAGKIFFTQRVWQESVNVRKINGKFICSVWTNEQRAPCSSSVVASVVKVLDKKVLIEKPKHHHIVCNWVKFGSQKHKNSEMSAIWFVCKRVACCCYSVVVIFFLLSLILSRSHRRRMDITTCSWTSINSHRNSWTKRKKSRRTKCVERKKSHTVYIISSDFLLLLLFLLRFFFVFFGGVILFIC